MTAWVVPDPPRTWPCCDCCKNYSPISDITAKKCAASAHDFPCFYCRQHEQDCE